MSNRGFLAVLAAIAFIGLLAFGLIAKKGAQIAVGEPAPDAAVQRLDGSGEVSLADYRGQWVLLNFWASWCDPCRDEAPAIEKFSNENKDNLVVIGMDTEDLSGDAQAFIREFGLTYEQLHDVDGGRKDAYGIFALPESFLIDPDGNLALIQRGPVDEQFLNEQVKPLIDGVARPE
jgi:cytochrome c biogenesis protein CcmG/thiol:disulfide interchange protein DsbE